MDSPENAPASAGKWLDASNRLRAEIEAGRWKSGEKFPDSAWMCGHLGLTQPTLRKTMRHLVEGAWVEQLVRGWRVAVPPERAKGLRVAFVRHCGPDGKLGPEAEREAFFRRALEQEAARKAMYIESWGISEEGILYRHGVPIEGEVARLTDGVVLSLWHMGAIDRVFSRFASLRIPLSIWDERSQGGRRPTLPCCRWFNSGYSTHSGRKIARFLQEQGHRAAAYISPYHGSQWSQRRLEGLSQVGLRQSEKLEVKSFIHGDHWDPSQFAPATGVVGPLMADISCQVGQMLSLQVEGVAQSVSALLRDRDVLANLDALFARALDDRSITAWVGANDDIALLAWTWLSSKKIRVGEEISLVGFDNTLRGQEAGLSSIGFREEELAVAMLDFVASPKRWRSGEVVELEGTLVVRRSTSLSS